MVIETARPENAEAIFGIYLEGWLEVYPNTRLGITKDQVLERQIGRDGSLLAVRVAYWRDKIAAADENQTVLVARLEGRVAGFVWPHIKHGRRRLGTLYVASNCRGLGIGSRLIEACLDFYKGYDVYLFVAKYNERAIKLYERFGFKIIGDSQTDYTFAGQHVPEFEMMRPGDQANLLH